MKITLADAANVCKEHGYLAVQVAPDGKRWIAINPFFIYTCAIVWGDESNLRDGSYISRFCYHNANDAVMALAEWKDRGFDHTPKGYIVQKPEVKL